MSEPDLRVGIARSTLEMNFYCRHFVACPRCGGFAHTEKTTEWYAVDRDGSGKTHSAGLFKLICNGCKAAHSVEFLHDKEANFRFSTYLGRLRGWGHGPWSDDVRRQMMYLGPVEMASAIISPRQFGDVVKAATTSRPAHPDELTYLEWGAFSRRVDEVLTALNELAKFPFGGAEEWFTKTWLDDATALWTKLHSELTESLRHRQELPAEDPRSPEYRKDERPPSINPFHSAIIRMHEKWLADKEGKAGARLVARKIDASDYKLQFRDLSSAIITDVDLDRANMEMVKLRGAELTRVTIRNANMDHAMVAGTTLTSCRFDEAWMAFANLGDAEITDCVFDGARLDRSTWYRSQITRSTFTNSKLNNAAYDKAVFRDCDFRGADFSLSQARVLGTGWDATFERCDLRDTKWDGVDLYRAKFIDCLFAGASGKPILTGVVVTGGDAGGAGALAAQLGVDLNARRQPEPAPVAISNVLTFELPHDEGDVLVDEAKRRGLETQVQMIRHGQQLFLHVVIYEPIAAPVAAELDAVLAAFRDRRDRRNMVTRATEVLDGMVDSGASFDETVAALVALGLTREEALEAVIDPGRLAKS